MVDAPRVVRAHHDRVLAPTLDDAQRRAVEHRGGAVLVLAGPGTGKTTTIVEAVVQRVEHSEITPDQALVLTFSRRAAGEFLSVFSRYRLHALPPPTRRSRKKTKVIVFQHPDTPRAISFQPTKRLRRHPLQGWRRIPADWSGSPGVRVGDQGGDRLN